MKKSNRSKLNKAIKILNNAFNIKSNNIMLVGSIALDLQGLLPEDRETHDVDLIVRMNNETWEVMKTVETVMHADNNFYNCFDNIMLKIDDVCLNIWKANGSEKLWGLKDECTGVWVKSAGEILKKKKSYGRLKDLNDITSICKNIL